MESTFQSNRRFADTVEEFVQDLNYVQAVNKMVVDYRKCLIVQKNKPIDPSILKDLISQDQYDFHKFRQRVKSMTESNCIKDDTYINKNINSNRYILIDKIEKIIVDILTDISNEQYPKFVLRNQKLWSNCVFNERILPKTDDTIQMTVVSFGAQNSRNKFCLILHLLSRIHNMLIRNITCTVRELYYQNINRVKCQRTIEEALSAVCCLLNVPQWELKLLSTSKGLIAGPLDIVTQEGHEINCLNAGGVLIPQDVNGIKSVKSNAKFILVIEKDATFQKLLDEGALERLRPCILITGKGYPDINTRLMLKLLVDTLKIPSLALVDADPHGIEIMCIYRYGSLSLSHISDKLTVPLLRWIGVHPTDIHIFGAPCLPLTARDKSKCQDLLTRPYCNPGSRLNEELQFLNNNCIKTEIEGIGTLSQAYLTDRYIPHKICSGDFI